MQFFYFLNVDLYNMKITEIYYVKDHSIDIFKFWIQSKPITYIKHWYYWTES